MGRVVQRDLHSFLPTDELTNQNSAGGQPTTTYYRYDCLLLLLFSSGKKRREFLGEIAEKNELEYIHFAILLYPDDVETPI